MKGLVDVYPYAQKNNEVLFLILKRSPQVQYSSQWRMVGGKIEEQETAFEAGRRELHEETGLTPHIFWTIPSINKFYDPKTDRVQNIPAFGAEVNPSMEVKLNHEHNEWKWISKDEIDHYIWWPEQKRLMSLLADIIIHKEILNEWIINE